MADKHQRSLPVQSTDKAGPAAGSGPRAQGLGPVNRARRGQQAMGNQFVGGLPGGKRGGPGGGAGDPWSALGAALSGGGGQEIPFLDEMEAAFGVDLSMVRAVFGAASLADADATAATDGNKIAFTGTNPSKEVVAEEVAHWLQLQQAGTGTSDDISDPEDGAEREAKGAGRAVARGGRAGAIRRRPKARFHRNEVASRRFPPGFDPRAKARQIHAAFDGWGTDERGVMDVLYTGRRELTAAIAEEYRRMYGETLLSRLRSELSGEDERQAIRLLENARFTLSDRVREAVDGWGTNEDAIMNGLERATADELAELAADAELMSWLRSDLNDADYAVVVAYTTGHGRLAAQIKRALDGWGTDEDAIWRHIGAASQEERSWVLTQGWVMSHLSSDLNESDYTRAVRMLQGTLTNLDKLEIAFAGWGTDEGATHAAIGALTAEEYETLASGQAKGFTSVGHLERRIEAELSGDDLMQAQLQLHEVRLRFDSDYRTTWQQTQLDAYGQDALNTGGSVLVAAGGQTMSAVGRIKLACRGWGTDEQSLWEVLATLSTSERQFIREQNPEGVLDAMRRDLSGTDYDRAMRALGEGSDAAVAVLENAMDGWGTDERAMYDMVDRIIADAAGATILGNARLMSRVRAEVSAAQYTVFTSALGTGVFSPTMRLRWATAMAGTDEDLVFELCRTHGESWRSGNGIRSDVDAVLQSELSTRDYWQALDLIRGEPQTEQERLERAKELLERERGGVSTWIMDGLSHSGENADDAWREYQGTYNTVYTDGEVSQEEQQLLDRDHDFSVRMTAEYQAAKASVANWAATIAVAIVGVVATILTAGAAGPFVAAIAAQLGGTAAIAAEAMVLAAALKVGLNRAIQGEGYDLTSSEALIDAVSASVEVGLAMVGNVVAMRAMEALSKTGLARAVGPALEGTFGQTGTRILGAGLDGAIDGTIGGVGEGMVVAMLNEDTWQGDMSDAFSSIGTSALLHGGMSGAGGFVAGAGIRSLGETFGPMVRARMSAGVPEGSVVPEGALVDSPNTNNLLPDGAAPGSVDDVMHRSAGDLGSSADDQARLFQGAVETNQRMQGIADEVTDSVGAPRSPQGLKGNRPGLGADDLDQDAFIGGVMEKNARKSYDQVGEMTDMSRGRIELDGEAQVNDAAMRLKQRLTDDFGAENVDYKGPRGDYKRHHILVRDANTGVWHEFQVGTKATTEFIEGATVNLPSGVRLHARADFHTVKYDVLDQLRNPKALERLGLPEDVAARVGLDELDVNYNQLFREAGSTTADQALPTNFAARQAALADEMAVILQRLEDMYPGSVMGLDTKLLGQAATASRALQMHSADFIQDSKAQSELFEAVSETNQRMQRVADSVSDEVGVPRSPQGMKGNKFGASGDDLDQDSFIAAVMEKQNRKNYAQVGEMGDMTRGRFDLAAESQVDDAARLLKQRLETQFGADNVEYQGPRGAYKRHHIVVRDPYTGISHEFQVGTKATTEFIEGLHVALPDGVALHTVPDFHTVKYDVLDNLKDPVMRNRLGLPDDITTRVGFDDLDQRYDKLFMESGSTTVDQPLPADFAARQQALADDMARIMRELEEQYPGSVQALDKKLNASMGQAADGSGGRILQEPEGDTIRRTQDDLPPVLDEHKSGGWKDQPNGKAFTEGTGGAGPLPETVGQGQLGDCYFIASGASVARADPDALRKLIKDNGDGTFEVALWIRKNRYSQPELSWKTVDARLPMSGSRPAYAQLNRSGPEGEEMWMALLEKRLAMEAGGYANITGGQIAKNIEYNGAFELLTGRSQRWVDAGTTNGDRLLREMDQGLKNNKPLLASSKSFGSDETALVAEAKKWNVYGNHAYSVREVDLQAKTVTLQNPWGSSHVEKLPIEDFKRFYRGLRVGT